MLRLYSKIKLIESFALLDIKMNRMQQMPNSISIIVIFKLLKFKLKFLNQLMINNYQIKEYGAKLVKKNKIS